jgi:hypothetical protein
MSTQSNTPRRPRYSPSPWPAVVIICVTFVPALAFLALQYLNGEPLGLPHAPPSSAAPPSPPQIHIGDWAWTKLDTLGCADAAIFDRLADLKESGDTVAVSRMMDQQRRIGACAVIPAGTKVFVEAGGGFSRPFMRCARPQGMTACLWLNENRLEVF